MESQTSTCNNLLFFLVCFWPLGLFGLGILMALPPRPIWFHCGHFVPGFGGKLVFVGLDFEDTPPSAAQGGFGGGARSDKDEASL